MLPCDSQSTPAHRPAYLEISDWENFVGPVLMALPEAVPACVIEITDPVSRRLLYTYVGVAPTELPLQPGPPHAIFDQIKRALPTPRAPAAGLPPFQGGLVGFVGYDHSRPETCGGVLCVDRLLVIDHARHRGFYISYNAGSEAELHDQLARWRSIGKNDTVVKRGTPTNEQWHHSLSKTEYCRIVAAAKRTIEEGELQQVILSLDLSRHAGPLSYALYRSLTHINAAQQNFYLRFAKTTLIGTPPSPYLRVHNGTATLEIGAGTRCVTGRTDEDDRSANELRTDHKELAEHAMLVAQSVQDMTHTGAVDVSPLEVRRFSHVMHLFTTLSMKLRPGSSAVDILARAFPPTGSTGTPREPAQRAIASLEMMPRGPYGGIYFMIGRNLALDSAIIERSMWITDNQIHLRVGAGITAGSVPEAEYAECMRKAEALLLAVESAAGAS